MRRKSVFMAVFGVLCSTMLFVTCQIGLGNVVDTEAPTIDVAYPPVSAVIKDTFLLQGTWSDDQGVTSVSVTVTDTATKAVVDNIAADVDSENKTWSVNLNNYNASAYSSTNGWQYADGTYQVTVVAKDAAGHSSGAASRSFTIDNTAPVLILNSPLSSGEQAATSYGRTFSVIGSYDDSNSVSKIILTLIPYQDGTLDQENKIEFEYDSIGAMSSASPLVVAQYFTEGQLENTKDEKKKATYQELKNKYLQLFYQSNDYDPNADIPLEDFITRNYYCTFKMADKALEYKVPGDAGAGNGNVSDVYYLSTDEFAEEFLSLDSYALDANKITGIINGTNKDFTEETRNQILQSLSNFQMSSSTVNETSSKISINPENNPLYSITGMETGFDANGNAINTTGSVIGGWRELTPETMTVKIKAGLDGTVIKSSSLKVEVLHLDRVEGGQFENPTVVETIMEDGRWLMDTGSGNATSGAEVELNFDLKKLTSLKAGNFYRIVVTGVDRDGNQIVPRNNDGYGFQVKVTSERPMITCEGGEYYAASSGIKNIADLEITGNVITYLDDSNPAEPAFTPSGIQNIRISSSEGGTVSFVQGETTVNRTGDNNYDFKIKFDSIASPVTKTGVVTYTVAFEVQDRDGGRAQHNVKYYIDTKAPDIKLPPANLPFATKSLTVTVNVTENVELSSLKWSTSNDGFNTVVSSGTLDTGSTAVDFDIDINDSSKYPDGSSFVVRVEAVDSVGNKTVKDSETTYTVDNSKPVFVNDDERVGGKAVSGEDAWFNSNSVSIAGSWTEAGSGINAIYYQTVKSGDTKTALTSENYKNVADGQIGTKDTGSIETYTTNITIGAGTNTLRMVAVDKVGNVSDVITRTIKMDNTVPVVRAESLLAKVSNGKEGCSPLSFAFTANDPSDAGAEQSGISGLQDIVISADTYSFSTTANTTYGSIIENEGVYTVTIAPALLQKLNAGSVSIIVSVKDNAGNSSNPTSVGVISVDKTAPVVKINSPAAPATVNKNITVTGTASDINGITKVDVEFAGNSKTETITLNASDIGDDGSWQVDFDTTKITNSSSSLTISAKATDGAGNDKTTSIVINVDQDTDRPVVYANISLGSLMSSSNYIWVKNTTTLSGSVSDDDGISKLEISLDGTNWKQIPVNNNSWSYDLRMLHTNASSLPTDKGELTQLEKNTNGENIIYFRVTDTKSAIPFVSSETVSNDAVKISDQTNTYGISAKPDSRLFVKVDTISPELSFTGIAVVDGTENNSDIQWNTSYSSIKIGGSDKKIKVKFAASDANGIDLSSTSLGGTLTFSSENLSLTVNKDAGYETFTTDGVTNYIVTFTLSDSNIQSLRSEKYDTSASVRIEISDMAGNSNSQNATISADYFAPVVGFISPSSSTTSSGGVSVYGSVDSAKTLYYAVSTSGTVKPESGISVTKWSDSDGNEKSIADIQSKIKYEQIKDATGSWFVYFDGDTEQNSSTHSITLNDYLETFGITDHNKIASGEFETITSLYIWIKAVDAVGNISETCHQIKLDPQGDRPSVSLSYPSANGSTLGGSVKIYGTATDIKGSSDFNIGVDSVWVQIISKSHEYNKSGWTGKTFGTLPTSEHPETPFALTKNDLDYLADAGYEIYNMKTYNAESPASNTAWVSGSSTVASGYTLNDYGILAKLQGASWNLSINNANEFNPASGINEVAFRIMARDKDKKFSEKIVSYATFDSMNPVIGNSQPLYLVESNTNAFSKTENYTASKEYNDDMYVRGDWYLIGSVEDADSVNYIKIGTDELVKNGNKIAGANWDVLFEKDPTTNKNTKAYFKYKLSTGSGLGTQSLTIVAEDAATGTVGHTEKNISVKYDNVSPELMGANSQSYSILPRVQQDNGFYRLESQVSENAIGTDSQSGVNLVAFYFMRRDNTGATESDRIYDPMLRKPVLDSDPENYISTGDSNVIYDSGLYWRKITVSRSKDSLNTLGFTTDEKIHEGGLVKIGGAMYIIKSVDGSSVTLDGNPLYSSASEEAWFAQALIVNNTIQETAKAGTKENGYPVEVSNDDGDGMEEYLKKNGSSYIWSASVVSKNIPDGPVEIHYVAFDKAGNYSIGIAGNMAESTFADSTDTTYAQTADRVFYQTQKTADNSNVNVLYVDGKSGKSIYNGTESAITNTNLKSEVYVSNNAPRLAGVILATDTDGNGEISAAERISSYSSGISATWATASQTYSAGTEASPAIKATGMTQIIPEILGGNGDIRYEYSISKNGAAAYYTKTGSDGIPMALATQSGADGAALPETPVTYTVKDFLSAGTTGTAIADGAQTFTFTFWDSTEATVCGTNSQKAVLDVAVDVSLRDTERPVARIKPFYWNDASDNSLFGESLENGHIELEEDWKNSIGRSSAGLNANLKDSDPKVSGSIKVEGVVHDNTLLTQITADIMDKTNIVLATYNPDDGSWYAGTNTSGTGTKIGYVNSVTGKWVYADTLVDGAIPSGATGGYAFKLENVTYGDLKAAGIIPSSSTEMDDTATVNQIDSKYGHNIKFTIYIDTQNASIVSKVADLNKVVSVGAKDRGSPTLDASSPKGYKYSATSSSASAASTSSAAWTAKYQMDVVPYVTSVKTGLSSLSRTPGVYDRTALGHYPVREVTRKKDGTAGQSETVSFEGFNLSNNTSLTVSTLVTKDDEISLGKSAVYDVVVNSIPSINNYNNNNASGSYNGTVNDDSTYTVLSQYAYNRQPNKVSNNRLTDDVCFDVWQFNSIAAAPISGKLEQPVMKIRPDGKIGFAFVNGPLYFSMGGSATSENYSYQYWVGSFDFFSSIGFTYDDLGNSWGVAAGGDINSTTGDKFFLASSKFGIGGHYDSASRGGANIVRMERIAQMNEDTPDVIDFDKQAYKSPSLVTTVHGDTTNVYLAYYDAMTDEIRFKAGGNSYVRRIAGVDNTGDRGIFVENKVDGYELRSGNNDYFYLCDENGNVTNTTKYRISGYWPDKKDSKNLIAFVSYDESGNVVEPAPGTASALAANKYKADYSVTGSILKLLNDDVNVYIKIISNQMQFGDFIDDKVADEPTIADHNTVSMIAGSNTGNNPGQYVALGAIKGTTEINDTVVVAWYDETERRLMYSFNSSPMGRKGQTDFEGWSTPIAIFEGTEYETAGEYCKISVDASGGVHIAAYDPTNLDLVYAYLPPDMNTDALTASDFNTCVVDSNGVVGSNLTIDVSLVNGKPVPVIGYYATSCIKPKMARFIGADITAEDINGAVDDVYTGRWEVTVVPTAEIIETQSNQHNDINIGLWKDSTGSIKNSVTGTYALANDKKSYDSTANGQVYGNGTKNPVLGYAIKNGASGDNIETAQMR